MNKNIFNTSYAIELDKNSSMYNHSKLFHYPTKKNKKILYFNGNSLGPVSYTHLRAHET